MSEFDEYFTDNDKPFAENLNDALLLSNVFDFTVPISMPSMFTNGQWVNTTSSRKCSVSLVTIEDLDGLSVTGANIQGTGILVLKFYPNFNSFGKITKLAWIGDVTECWITDKNNVTVEANVENGVALSGNANQLAEYLIHLKINGTLSDLVVTCENKRHRFGATVGVSGVTGLEERLTSIEAKNTEQDTNIGNKVDKVTGKGLSTNDYTNAEKNKVTNLKNVATSGSYNDLTNKPAIPTKTSDLTNDGADGSNIFVSNNDSRLSNARAPTSHTHGNVTNDGKIGSTSGKIIVTGTNGVLQGADSITKSKISDFSHTHTKSQISDFSHTHTKSQISDFPSTMAPSSHAHGSITNDGKLSTANGIVITDANKNIGVSTTITKSQISDFPSTMTPSSHTHGDLTNDGKITTTYVEKDTNDFPVVADSSDGKKLKRGQIYTGFVWDNYARPNIGTAAQATQTTINAAIDTALGNKVDTTDSRLSNATTTNDGLMSSTDKTKLDGVATGATKNTIDTALSSTSTNAVQNKVVNTALSGKANSSHSHGYIKSDGTMDIAFPNQESKFVVVQDLDSYKIGLTNKLDKSVMGLDWKNVTLTDMSGVTLQYNDLFCVLKINGTYTIGTANSYTNIVTGTIPTTYRPPFSRVQLSSGDVLIRLKVTDNGKIQYYSPQTFTNAVDLNAEFIWSR